MALIYTIITGLIAGWLTGIALKGKGFGWIGNILVGVLGAVVGKIVFGLIGFESKSFLSDIIAAAAGAILLLLAIGIVKKNSGNV